MEQLAKSGSDLTVRERQVLEQLHRCLRNGEIADSLEISKKTVETHIRHIFLKLGCKNRTQAVLYAQEQGYL